MSATDRRWWHDSWPAPGLGHRHALRVRSVAVEGSHELLEHERLGRILVAHGEARAVEADVAYREMAVHVPLLGRDRPTRRVLIVGGEDGRLVEEVLRHDEVKQVVVLLLDPSLHAFARRHAGSRAFTDPRVTYVSGGVGLAGQRFDLIVGDLFARSAPPWLDLEAHLGEEGTIVVAAACVVGHETKGVLAQPLWECVATTTERYLIGTFVSPGGYVAFRVLDATGRSLREPRRARPFTHYDEHVHRAAFAIPVYLRGELPLLRPGTDTDP